MKPTLSFIGRAGVLLALCAQPCSDAYASHLQPEEALSMLGSVQHRSASQSPLRLAYSQAAPDGAESAVYVFNREDAPGFYVLAADDAVGDVVLGYSHTGYFSADNIAPGMRWLLEAYSADVSACAASGAPAQPREVPPVLRKVEPLTMTKWNQDEPYNGKCPVLLGRPSVTGCVATATAQIMKVHQWPISGTGSHSYNYTLNGSPVHISSDFSSHTYDWANMLDDYAGVSATQVQKDAVAQLMFDCGVAADMLFTPVTSSANSLNAATGMLEYFGYDKSMQYLKREWFSDRDWNMLMHSQVSQGMPVLYSGQGYGQDGSAAGHAFVLDGYDGEGYFHINWGWGGVADGYYTLDNLSPTHVGIGGGLGSYNSGQEVLVDIRPSVGSPIAANFALAGTFCTSKSSYRLGAEVVTFMSGTQGGGFFSYTPLTVNAEIGIMNTLDGNVVSIGMYSIAPLRGFGSFGVDCRLFPEGEYDVFPVFKVEGGEWTPMRYEPSVTSGRLHFKRDQTNLMVENVVEPYAQITSTFVSSTPDDAADNGYSQGKSYTVTYSFKVSAPCSTKLTMLVQNSESAVICESEPVEATFAAGEYKKTFHITIPENVPSGEYYFGMMCVDENGIMMWAPNKIVEIGDPVVEATAVTLNATAQQLNVGESFTLVATVLPENATDKTVAWSTTDAAVATVDAEGKVTAISAGTATIIATCGTVSAGCAITVVNPVIDATAITLNTEAVELVEGDTYQLIATVLPEDTTDPTVTWSSSDASVATVDSEGKVTAISGGSATITATCGTVSAICAVTVSKRIIDAASITLNADAVELVEGDTYQLIATILPEDTTDPTVTWSSSNAAVTTVDSEGKVTAMSAGSATITATCGSVSASCQVEVKPLDGVWSVVADGISIRVAGEFIYIHAPEDAQVAVYDVAGKLCYIGYDRAIPVENNKLYIIVVGDKVFKVKA